MYENEKAFVAALVAKLRKQKYFVTYIETGKVTLGVPDLYVCNKEEQVWIEAKRVWQKFNAKKIVQVPWRPGQQAWSLKHYKASGVPVLIFCCFNDCVKVLEYKKFYEDDLVPVTDFIDYKWS